MKITVPVVDTLHSILPDEPLLMMGAGPVPIPQSVANANGIVINHLGETMKKITHQIKLMAGYIFQTNSPWILGVAGPGSAAMEMAVANLIWQNTTVLSICNGFFSSRLAEMAERAGGDVNKINILDKRSAEANNIRAYVEKYRPKVITMVQGETSNTTHNHQLALIGNIAKEFNCYLIVDAVCTLSTMPLNMDQWGIDAVITGGQKGLSSIPGVSLVAFSEKAWSRIHSRPKKIPQWTLDATLASNFWHRNSYHYTAPVSGLLALHEAMRLICDETLTKRFRRHLICSQALQSAITVLGLELYIGEQDRLNSVVGITLPKNMESKTICEHISSNYRVEIAGSFESPIIRIGQMGEQCREHNLFRTIHALGSTFNDLGFKVNVPAGMAELEENL
jgi:aspartate aminotransferase-like enzyme